jgi:hypothetical protein
VRTVVGVLLFTAAFSANAQAIYKCVGAKGAVSYQSIPCTSGATAARTINYVAAPPTLAPRAPYVAPRPAPIAYRPTSAYASPTYDERAKRKANCQAAKDSREATLDRVGLSRTFDLLRQLDDDVALACKGLEQ